MTDLVFHHEPDQLPPGVPGIVPVLMYGRRPPRRGTASIGGPVRAAVRRLGVPVHRRAFDLLTIAMAVTAADTFVDRKASDDGWARVLRLRLPLSHPAPWLPVIPMLEEALRFLSGDLWTIEILPDGPVRPPPQTRGHLTNLAGHDCVSLFSGGLDSAIGVLDLMATHRKPVLVSHSYRGDAERQVIVDRLLPIKVSRFSAVANPLSKLGAPNDVQMRTRSFNFLAYGALVAATMVECRTLHGPVELFVPENGLIALNPPLTSRRIGALSTRTTHPHFLGSMQRILDAVGIPVRICNPYAAKTKGEMLSSCADQKTLGAAADRTVSCGKWKRKRLQCGRCVPCIIRRASFHAAGMDDNTPYDPAGTDLAAVLAVEKARDDLLAMIQASRRVPSSNMAGWLAQTGPLPMDRTERDELLDVARRGMAEVRAYLNHLGLLN
ncbi:Qat anti-phage system QueC-like protein QatC [Thalassobaculum sp.]|uniref:Qat anti-phage system QueC-like protein QatC n=1 Tax=Thalassobaculum sp. TaxID=2022740 RepID=UPI0032EBB606